MSETLIEIAEKIKNSKEIIRPREQKESDVKVSLIYAFNGTGKTRLSKEFQKLICGNSTSADDIDEECVKRKFLYYSAYTEDLFYWDNDLENNEEPKLKIQNNDFTNWILKNQGKENAITQKFQHYVNSDKLTPAFNLEKNEVAFSYQKGDDTISENIKISKGEESLFIWCVFYSIFEQVVEELNNEVEERESDQFNDLEYIFIDDPVTSLDENHLIELAVDLATLIKSSKSDVKFVITTHNPLFYNVLFNEFSREKKTKKYILKKYEDGTFELQNQSNDSPFSYHLFLRHEIEKAIETDEIHKYHFNYLRNILEKTSTFLGKEKWSDLLPKNAENRINPYETRIINIASHSAHSADETFLISENDKKVLKHLMKKINEIYDIKIEDN